MSAEDESPNGGVEGAPAGEDATALATAADERASGADEPGGSVPRTSRPARSSWRTPGPPTSACPTRPPPTSSSARTWTPPNGPRSPLSARGGARHPAAPADLDPPSVDDAQDGEDQEFEARLERLEAIQRQVVLTAREHEAARVKRKVVASTTGAGAAGFIPLLLQLVDA